MRFCSPILWRHQLVPSVFKPTISFVSRQTLRTALNQMPVDSGLPLYHHTTDRYRARNNLPFASLYIFVLHPLRKDRKDDRNPISYHDRRGSPLSALVYPVIAYPVLSLECPCLSVRIAVFVRASVTSSTRSSVYRLHCIYSKT